MCKKGTGCINGVSQSDTSPVSMYIWFKRVTADGALAREL